jgi:hypothetical protein
MPWHHLFILLAQALKKYYRLISKDQIHNMRCSRHRFLAVGDNANAFLWLFTMRMPAPNAAIQVMYPTSPQFVTKRYKPPLNDDELAYLWKDREAKKMAEAEEAAKGKKK